jgi:hypothetical protein
MQETGNSEFSNSKNVKYSMNFWQNFLLTLFGAAGLISMVADGPLPITVVSFVIVIAILLRIVAKSKRN